MTAENPFFDMIVENVVPLAGGYAMAGLILIAVITIILLAARANKVVILMVLVPLVSGLATVAAGSWVGISGAVIWVSLALWLVMGLIFAGIFWAIIR